MNVALRFHSVSKPPAPTPVAGSLLNPSNATSQYWQRPLESSREMSLAASELASCCGGGLQNWSTSWTGFIAIAAATMASPSATIEAIASPRLTLRRSSGASAAKRTSAVSTKTASVKASISCPWLSSVDPAMPSARSLRPLTSTIRIAEPMPPSARLATSRGRSELSTTSTAAPAATASAAPADAVM